MSGLLEEGKGGVPTLAELVRDQTIGNPRKMHVIVQCASCGKVYHRTTLARIRTADAFEENLHAQAWLEHVARFRCSGEADPGS